ncbi:MAG: hypothetical protein P1U34_11825 [Coxiellaceae bacterium]|nr:hypothetical protein [Coxiellaceae bacterium]
MTISQVLDKLHDYQQHYTAEQTPLSLAPEEQSLLLERYATLSIHPSSPAFKNLNTTLNHTSLREHWHKHMRETYGVYPEPKTAYVTGRSNFQIFCGEWAMQQYCKSGKTKHHYRGLSIMMGRYRTLALEVTDAAKIISKKQSTAKLMLWPLLRGIIAAHQSCNMHGAIGYDLLACMHFAIGVKDANTGRLHHEKLNLTQQLMALSTAQRLSTLENNDSARRNAGFFSSNPVYQKYNLARNRSKNRIQAKKRLTMLKYYVTSEPESDMTIEVKPETDNNNNDKSFTSGFSG